MNDQSVPPRLLMCCCQHCNAQIDFDAGGIKSGETITLDCPHCQKETSATIPLTEFEIRQNQIEAEKNLQEQAFKERVLGVRRFLQKRLENGKSVYFYDSIYLRVDSVVDEKELADEFKLAILRHRGLHGWEVVQAVPKTIGVGLKNMNSSSLFGEEWGGGIGGNVAGVHIILKKQISLDEVVGESLDDDVGRYIATHLDDFV